MKIRSFCINYFNSVSILKTPGTRPKARAVAKACVISYFLIIPPVIFAIGLAVSTIAHGATLLKRKITKNWNSSSNNIITRIFFQKGSKNKQIDPPYVEILNNMSYINSSKQPITIPAGGAPTKYERTGKRSLKTLRQSYPVNKNSPMTMQFKDLTSEQAIAESKTDLCIALVFANSEHVGGGSGFHRNPNYDPNTPNSKLYIYDHPPARAQEESIAVRSTLLDSLFQVPHSIDPHFGGCFYNEPLDSTKMAYVSDNHLFGTPAPCSPTSRFEDSILLPAPKAVTFVTSAAKQHQGKINCCKNSPAYNNAGFRIGTHLLAAADRAGKLKQTNPGQTVEIVLGAFGCGVFAPDNATQYSYMIAGIYAELLPRFAGFFDVVTFAVPTFGGMANPKNANMNNPSVANHVIFKDALKPLINKET